MKKQSFITKVLALSMALLMLLSMFPVSAADAPGNTEAPTVESSGNVTDENGSSENTGDATEIVPAETQTSVPETTGEGEEPTPTDAVDTPTVAPTEEPTQAPTEEPFEVPGEITYKYELPEKAKQAKDGETDYFTDLSKITVTVPVTVATVAGEGTVQAPKFAFLSKSKYEENKTDLGWLTDEVTVVEKKKDGAVVAFVATIDVSKIFKTTDAKNGKYVLVTSAAGSEDVVKNIVFDNTAPVLSVSYSATPVNGWFTDTVTVNCTVTDDSPCTINGNSTNNYSFTVTNEGKNNYSIQAVDIFGNPSKEDIEVNVDKTAPIFGSGTKFAEIWTNDDANLTVAVTDELSGVNVDNKFGITFKGETTEIAPSGLVGENKYGLSIPDAQNGEYTITVYDKAGHKNSFIATMSYVDKDAPVASDFKVSITPADTALSKILNIITFGIYANKDVNVTVSADSNGNAPIRDINMYVNGSEEAQKADSNAIEGDVYSETYKFSKDTNITDIKFDATDEADNKSDKISITDEGVVVTAGGVELEGEFKELIITEAAPNISATVTTGVENKEVNDINYLKETGNVTLKVEAEDNLTGIDKNGLVAYFGKEENFTYDKENNKWTVKDLEPLSIDANSTADALPAAFAIDLDSSDKVTSANAEYTVKVEEDGAYVFLVLATNNASNTGYYTEKFFVDNKGPEVEFVEFPTEWAKEHTVKFKVTDIPELSCVGVDDKCIVKVIGSDGKAIVNNNIIYNEVDGTYSFIVNSNKSYTITVKDILGNENSQETPEVVKADGKSPVIGDFSYSNDNNNEWTAENVKVSFDVTDELSGVAEVKVVGADGKEAKVEKNDSTYFFTANKQQTYTVTATDKAGNTTPDNKVKTTGEIKFENAVPNISKIVFEGANENASGGYSTESVVVKVYAISGNKNEKNSGISKILLKNGSSEIDKNPDKKNPYVEDGFTVQEFILEPPKKYKISITVVSGTGVETESVNLSGVETWINGVKEDDPLYEYVVDKSSPIFTFGNSESLHSFNSVNTEKETPVYGGKTGTVYASVSNELSGINVDEIEVYFGKSSQFTNNIPDTNELKPLDNVSITGTKDKDNDKKVVIANIEATVETEESGNYVLFVIAETLTGATAHTSQVITIDNSGPEITNISYNKEWSNEPIVVSFTVSDNALGVKDVEVVGDKDKKDYDLTGPDTDGKYTFTSEKYQTYTITAKDKLDNESIYGDDENEKIETLYDVEKPVVEIKSYNDGDNEWTNSDTISGVEVKFTVTDEYSGVDEAGITIKDSKGSEYNEYGEKYTSTLFLDTDGITTDTYGFIVNKYDNFDILVKDIAGNYIERVVTTEKVKYDIIDPVIVNIKFENVESTDVVSRVLNFLTFGIYGNTDVVMTVTAVDEANTDQYTASSTIKDITVTYAGKPLDKASESHTQNDVNTDTAIHTFILPKSETTAYDAKKFELSVVDNAENSTGGTLSDMRGLIHIPDGATLNEDFEIVLTSGKSEINGIETKYKQAPVTNSEGVVVYDGENATYTTTITETLSGINTDSIVGYFGKAEYFIISEDGSSCVVDEANVEKLSGLFGGDDITKNEKGKVSEVKISYQRNDTLETGEYIFLVKATNNAGNENIRYTNTFIDNSAPEFEILSYSNKVDGKQVWTNKPVTVEFKAWDNPAENYCGIKSVKVVGVTNEKTYLNYMDKDNHHIYEDTFSFEADYCQVYEITVTDMFGSSYTTQTEMVKHDDDIPEITNILYFDENCNEFNNESWKSGNITVQFTINDTNEAEDDISDIAKLDVDLDNPTVIVTGTELDKDGKVKTYEVEEITSAEAEKGIHTYKFTVEEYDQCIITATDIAGNVSIDPETNSNYKTDFIKIDKVAPIISNIRFESNPDFGSKILNFLTFGLYSSGAINMIVTAEDEYASSDFSDLIVKITGKDFKTNDIITHEIDVEDITSKDGDNSERIIKETIEIPSDLVINSDDIIVTVTDTAGNSNVAIGTDGGQIFQSLTDLKDVIENDNVWKNAFEIYSGKEAATIVTNVINKEDNKPHTVSFNNKNFKGQTEIDWYATDDLDIQYTVTDTNSKINKIRVWINSKDVTPYCSFSVDGKEATIDPPGVFTDFDNHTGSKEDEVIVTLNLSNEYIKNNKILNFASSNGDFNTVQITVTSNNGVTSKSKLAINCIDNVAPQITEFKFNADKKADTDTLKGELPETVIEKDYGYFFKDKTNVTVTATDVKTITEKVTNDKGKEENEVTKINGSGLKTIVLYGVDYVTKDVVSFGTSNVKGNNTQQAEATFTIPANFKGSVFAYATDNVENRSLVNTPDNTIVEDEPMHKKNSFAKVSIDNDFNKKSYVGKDNNGYKLFNGDVKVNIEIADTYTGLENVTYSIKAIGYGGKTVTVLDDRNLTDPNSKWSIIEQHDNIVQKLKRTITLQDEYYNYNSIQVTVKGIDNAGFEIEAKSELFSIDTIAPEIKIEYNNVTGNTDRDSKTYYKDTRVATVTVRERNFDPADFDWSGVVNEHGSPVPRAEGTSNWSTNYTDFTENSTHTAILTFSEDGDYSIDLAFEDMATNSDTEKGEEFTIDTIDPVVEVSYDNNNARNGKYYAQGRTATITVREHNFDPTDMYVTYTPSATGPDNSTSATPPTISWGSPSGDVCTGTIVFDRNGSYQFTLRVKDKSLRESTEFTQEEFVVDTYIGTVENDKDSSIEFNNVKNENAYAGTIAPQVVFSDYNYDDSTLSLRKISYDYKTKKSVEVNANHLIPHAVSSSFGVTYNFNDFPKEEENDGIYILTATIIDKAGNPHDRTIMFSVNRFGSTFMLGDEKSEKLVDDTYTNDAPDLSIIEINVNPVTAQTVTLSKNTTSEKLEKGKQYTIGEEGNKNKWYKYTYKINKANFNDEGDYTVTVSSEDKDGNVVSNRTAQTKKRNCPVSFVVDKTKPVISIEGIEDNGYTKEASQDVRISCLDANLDKDSLVIKKNGEVLKVDEDYTVEDLVGELTAEFTLKSEGGQTDYDIEVSVKDYANNENGDDVQDYIINATLLTQYLNSPLAIILTFVLLAAVAVIIILIVRKKKKEE